VLLVVAIGHAAIGPATQSVTNGSTGNITGLATLIFTTYVFPFEVTSALLITAALGAMVLAHRELLVPKPTQRELARQRVASGRPTPLPSPGVFALHNAVDLPALLPDGSPSELSVSSMLARRELGDDGAPMLPPVPEESGGPGPDYDNPAGRLAGDGEPVEASTQGGADA
jgi:NADH-quinone oxidoreductase subunit J